MRKKYFFRICKKLEPKLTTIRTTMLRRNRSRGRNNKKSKTLFRIRKLSSIANKTQKINLTYPFIVLTEFMPRWVMSDRTEELNLIFLYSSIVLNVSKIAWAKLLQITLNLKNVECRRTLELYRSKKVSFCDGITKNSRLDPSACFGDGIGRSFE